MPGLLDGTPRLTRLCLPAALREALIAEALETPGREVCGLIGGIGDRATTRYALANVADEPATSFFIEPRGQLRAMQVMRARGEALVGIYHSHPHGPATPSARDVELAAYPGVAYLIISLAAAGAPAIGAFVFDGKAFSTLPLADD